MIRKAKEVLIKIVNVVRAGTFSVLFITLFLALRLANPIHQVHSNFSGSEREYIFGPKCIVIQRIASC